MPKVTIDAEAYNEQLNKYEEMADYFVTMMETVSGRILETLYEDLPEEYKNKTETWLTKDEYYKSGKVFDYPTRLMRDARDFFEYDRKNLPIDEVKSFEWYSDLAKVSDTMENIATSANNLMKQIENWRRELSEIAKRECEYLIEDRSDQFGSILSEDGFRLIINKYKRDLRKELNKVEEGSTGWYHTKKIVARDVEIHAERTDGKTFALEYSYDPSAKTIHNIINNAVKNQWVRIFVLAQTRREDQHKDQNHTHKSPPFTLWENPDEDVKALRAFSDL
jgi:hypothetical protein